MKNIQKIINVRKKEYIINFADFETLLINDAHNVTCYSIYDSRTDTFITKSIAKDTDETNITSNSNNLLSYFIHDCLSLITHKYNKTLFYFHNLGKFDGIFILHQMLNCIDREHATSLIFRDNVIYEITIEIDGKKIIFRDSLLLYPGSLSSFAQIFNIDDKIKFDHNNHNINNYKSEEFISSLRIYCEHDVRILKECFKEYNNIFETIFNISITDSLSLPGLAFKVFRKNFYNEKFLIKQSRGHMDTFIRSSYKGGIAEVYRPKLDAGYHYDVNSLYPYIMKTSKMPIGDCKYEKYSNNKLDIENFFGFIEVEVECTGMYIPFLTINDSERGLISPVGSWTGIYFSEEIKYALTLGYKFNYLSGYRFKSNPEVIFDQYVSKLYDIRVKNRDTGIDKVMKILLNSLYGRFGMSNEIFKTKIIDKSDKQLLDILNIFYNATFRSFPSKVLTRYSNKPDFEFINTLMPNFDKQIWSKIVNEYDNKSDDLNIAVHIASAITAYARIYMHKIKNKYRDNIYYSDTDSIILDIQIDDNLVSNSEIGLLKLEGLVKNALFIAPKLYYMEQNNTEIMKVKGINKKYFSKEYYNTLYHCEEPLNTIKTERRFIKDHKLFNISRKDVDVNITGIFKKREKIYADGVWVDTFPININTK